MSEPLIFIRLTATPEDVEDFLVRVDRIDCLLKREEGTQVSLGADYFIVVSETPDEILQKMSDAMAQAYRDDFDFEDLDLL